MSHTKSIRDKHRKVLIEKLGSKCDVCYKTEPTIYLVFHHRDPTEKSFGIAKRLHYKLETLIPEAEKCILLCRTCHAEHHEIAIVDGDFSSTTNVRRSYRKKKQRLVDAHGGCCVICKYNKALAGLEFHHLIASNKSFTLSGKAFYAKWEPLWAESLKCVLVCSNCHQHIEYGHYSQKEIETMRSVPVDPCIAKKEYEAQLSLCLCGNTKYTKSTQCKTCASAKLVKIEWPEVTILRQRLKTTSFVQLGKELGVSDNAIRKHLKKFEHNTSFS